MRSLVIVAGVGLWVAAGCGEVKEEADARTSPIDAAAGSDASSGADAGPPECTESGDCDDGLYCNGAETCADMSCEAGADVDCNDGIDCTDDSCDDDLDGCVHLANHELCANPDLPYCDKDVGCRDVPCTGTDDCDDGTFCNGPETCDIPGGETMGSCVSGDVPICADDLDCTVDFCDVGSDTCKFAPDHGACDNGLYCDGDEICDTDIGCTDGLVPTEDDGVECTIDTCNEATDSFDHEPDDDFCQNASWCDGSEYCDALDDCQTGTPVMCESGDACKSSTCVEELMECTVTPTVYSVDWSMTSVSSTSMFGNVDLTCEGYATVYSEAPGTICDTAFFNYSCGIDSAGNPVASAAPGSLDFSCLAYSGEPDGAGCSVLDLSGESAAFTWVVLSCCI